MAQNKMVSRNFALVLGVICIIAIIVAGVFAFSYFTKPTDEKLDTSTPTATSTASITANPTSTPSRIQITPNPSVFGFQTIAPTNTPNQTKNLPDDVLTPRDDILDALNKPNIIMTNLTINDHGDDTIRYPAVQVNCTVTNTGLATAYHVNLTLTAYKNVNNEFVNMTLNVTDALTPQQSVEFGKLFRYASGEFWYTIKMDTLILTPTYTEAP